jgi:hypothetical protein
MTSKFEVAAVKGQIEDRIAVKGLSPDHSFLTFPGILPLTLPDNTLGVVLPDIHAPAHHVQLMWAVERFLANTFRAHTGPKLLILVGDLADIFALSRHPKGLRTVSNAQWEFDSTRRLLDRLIEACGPGVIVIVIPGNHEDRIYRYLQDLAPQLGSLVNPHSREPLSFHAQLGYKADDNVVFIYGTEERGGFEGGILMNNDLGVHHGIIIRPRPGFSPLGDMDRWMHSIVHGHTHRLGMVARNISPDQDLDDYVSGVLRGFELGCLANMDHSFMAYSRQMWPNWHYGLGVINVHNGVVHLQPVPIAPVKDERGREKLTFVYAGNVYTESDR